MRVVVLVALVGFAGAIEMAYHNVADQIAAGEPRLSLRQGRPS